MLKLTVDAGLPVVAIRTRDTINLSEVVQEVTGRKALLFNPAESAIAKHKLYYLLWPPAVPGSKFTLPLEGLYGKLVEQESTLLIVNPPEVAPLMFDAGELPIPNKMKQGFMMEITDNEDLSIELTLAVGGLTLKEVAEMVRLTMARDSSLTSSGLVRTRQQSFRPQDGLSFVDPAQALYIPNEDLEAWALREHDFFLGDVDPRLIPRGLLLDGPPGVGKTAGAKYLARKWGVPLYRLDMGATQSKWVGESEAKLIANLARIDNEEPCILLLDEIEKVSAGHGSSDTSGVGANMQSQLLWWLAEHHSRVLAVMTTNNKNKLPPELYRQGRIDRVFYFTGLEPDAAVKFAYSVLQTFKKKPGEAKIVGMIDNLMKTQTLPTNPPTIAHAAITTAVYDGIKSGLF